MNRLTHIFLLAVVGASGCTSVQLAPVRVLERRTAAGAGVHRVVALPATCGALDVTPHMGERPCEGALSGVDGSVRATLAFRGLDVVDSERLNASTWSRVELDVTDSSSVGPTSTSRDIKRAGALFADAPPATQRAILREIGADGVVNTRVWIGAGIGVSGRRTVEVQVRIIRAASGALVWVRRCDVEVGMMEMDSAAMERAARCAARFGGGD